MLETTVNILALEKVSKSFIGVRAVHELSFAIKAGEIVGLIGPNGAGKTTTVNIISGVVKPDSGRVLFKNIDITGRGPDEVCRMGIARTYQIPRPLKGMTVLENVMVACIFGRRRVRSIYEAKNKARQLLESTGLGDKMDMVSDRLSLVDLRKLEFARALATGPEIILLDEVMAGLSPNEIEEQIGLIRSIIKDNMSILMIEHMVDVVVELAHRIVVLDHGVKIADGTPEEIKHDEEVISAYLGE